MEAILIAPEQIVGFACAALAVLIAATMNFILSWNTRRRWLSKNGRIEVQGCLEQSHLPEKYAAKALIAAPKFPVTAAIVMATSAVFLCMAVYCLGPFFPSHYTSASSQTSPS